MSAYRKLPTDDVVSLALLDEEAGPSDPQSPLEPQSQYLQPPEDAPLGRHLGLFSTIIMFVSRILGSGFLAISSGMYNDCGQSPFYFLLSWTIASVLAFAGLYVYLELGSLIPRSGGTKVFLEFIYDSPYMMTSVIISLYSIIFGFSLLNILVFGEYFLHALDIKPTLFRTRLVGLALLYTVCFFHGMNRRHGVLIQDFLGLLKLALAAIIILTGMWAILLPTLVTGLEKQLHWSEFYPVKTHLTLSSFAGAVIKGTFAYAGWNSALTVTNEIKDPVRTLKVAGLASLASITITFIAINVTYLVVIPSKEIASSGELIGAVLFEKVFGYHFGRQFLTLSSALCTGGNVFVVLYSISRVSQEVFREGFLPFSSFMASNWPSDAPLPALLLSCLLSTIVIVATPGGDMYSYVVSLESYPQQIFIGLCAIGVFILRRRHPEVVAPIRASIPGTILLLLITGYLIILPLVGDNPNPASMQNWIPYTYLGLLSLFVSFLYWLFMFVLGPMWGKYELHVEKQEQKDGLIVKRWYKIYRN